MSYSRSIDARCCSCQIERLGHVGCQDRRQQSPRKNLAWKLGPTMAASDEKETLDLVPAATGITKVRLKHRPRLLSDNDPCCVSDELRSYLKQNKMEHTRGAPYHPMTQGKIERWHRTTKNVLTRFSYGLTVFVPLSGQLAREIQLGLGYPLSEVEIDPVGHARSAPVAPRGQTARLSSRGLAPQE